MKGYEHHTETIEAYVTDQLSAEERTAFEAILAKDPGLQEAVETEKMLSDLVLEQDLNKIRNKIKTDLNIAEKKNKIKKSVSIATLIIASITATYFYISQQKPSVISEKSNEVIVTKNVVSEVKNEIDVTINKNLVKHESKAVLQNPTLLDSTKQIQLSQPSTKIIDTAETVKHQIIEKPIQVEKLIKQQNTAQKACVFERMDASLASKPSQKGLSTGAITINLPHSIADKLVFSLNDNGEFVKETQFSELAKGAYHIVAKDTKECEYQLGQIIVKETNCISDYQRTFSPDLDSPWQIPVLTNENATIIIKNKAGENMYSFQGEIGNNTYWNGQNLGGNIAPIGVYKTIVSYSNGEDCVYSITLFR